MHFFILSLLVILGAYLIGSFPTGYLAGKCCHIDIQSHGSGNIGATNVLRVLNKKWGYTVFAIDLLKGTAAVAAASALEKTLHLEPKSFLSSLAALSVLLGHSFPIWLGFRGGKGIATAGGVMLALFPVSFLISLSSWIIIFYWTRYVSLASIVASIMLPFSTVIFYCLGFYYPQLPSLIRENGILVTASFLMAVITVARHRNNIKRLLTATESRFERRKKPL
ncbi:MAG: glycerol-3-phosphate 1-O-acyltransferase PlsY [Chthoniobacterales bacterium]|nr:glycerol-3-phosphate 1-O-acyltransferase PlsY [Chthoniobacterales bacterium]